MMNRREWLRNATLLAAGVIAADQLELLDRLAPRSLFAAWGSPPKLWGDGIHDDTAALQWRITDMIARLPAGGRLVLPHGTYRVGRTVTFPYTRARYVVDGSGSLFTASPALQASGGPFIRIEGGPGPHKRFLANPC